MPKPTQTGYLLVEDDELERHGIARYFWGKGFKVSQAQDVGTVFGSENTVALACRPVADPVNLVQTNYWSLLSLQGEIMTLPTIGKLRKVVCRSPVL